MAKKNRAGPHFHFHLVGPKGRLRDGVTLTVLDPEPGATVPAGNYTVDGTVSTRDNTTITVTLSWPGPGSPVMHQAPIGSTAGSGGYPWSTSFTLTSGTQYSLMVQVMSGAGSAGTMLYFSAS